MHATPAADGLAAIARTVCQDHGNDPAQLIEILHEVQARLGWVPEDVLAPIAHALNLSRAEVHGVASFYHDFRTAPPPAGPTVRLCRAEACQSVGSEVLAQELAARGIATEAVYCLGNCALGPAAMVDGALIGRARADVIAARVAGGGA